MPKFLLITILILTVLGHIFAVNEYISISPPENMNIEEKKTLEDSSIDEVYIEKIELPGSLEIVRIPTSYEDIYLEELSLLTNDDDCLYFEGEIPKLGVCEN